MAEVGRQLETLMGPSNHIECPHCATRLNVKNPSIFGKTINCPKCTESFLAEVPAAPDEDEFLNSLESLGGDLGQPFESYRPPTPLQIKPTRAGKSANRPKKKAKSSTSEATVMPVLAWPFIGLAAGLVPGLFWIGIGYFAHRELGWIAWGVGLCVGWGLRIAAGGAKGIASGALAVVISILVIFLCKFSVALLLTAQFADNALGDTSDDGVKLYLANSIMEDEAENGAKNRGVGSEHDWSKFKSLDQFPREIRDETEERWENMSEEERDNIRDEMLRFKQIPIVLMAIIAFLKSFRPLDLLWFFLASVSAYRVGSGGRQR